MKRIINITVEYDLNSLPYSEVAMITPKEIVHKMVQEAMEDYFCQDEGYCGIKVEVVDVDN